MLMMSETQNHFISTIMMKKSGVVGVSVKPLTTWAFATSTATCEMMWVKITDVFGDDDDFFITWLAI